MIFPHLVALRRLFISARIKRRTIFLISLYGSDTEERKQCKSINYKDAFDLRPASKFQSFI